MWLSLLANSATVQTPDIFPESIVFTSDGKFAYVTYTDSPLISTYSIESQSGKLNLVGTSNNPTGQNISSAVIDPSGKVIYLLLESSVVGYSITDLTGTIAGKTNTITATNPQQMIFANINSKQYIYIYDKNEIIEYEKSQSGDYIDEIGYQQYPYKDMNRITINSSENFLYVTNYENQSVTVFPIDQRTGQRGSADEVISLGYHPSGIAFLAKQAISSSSGT